MNDIIDYNKVVDILDEGIMQLSIYKKNSDFPPLIRSEIISILNFILRAQKTEFKELLYDKNISIDFTILTSINKSLNKINCHGEEILSGISLLEEMEERKLTNSKIETLQKVLMNISIPIWHSISIEQEYE